MWSQGSPEEHSLIVSRRRAGLEPDRFGYCERARSTAGHGGDLSDEEMFDRVDQPLRFSARVEHRDAEDIEYRCVCDSANRSRAISLRRPRRRPRLPLPQQFLAASELTSCIDLGRTLVESLHSLQLPKEWNQLAELPTHKLLARFSAADDDASGAGFFSMCRLLPSPKCSRAGPQGH
jgi:hypothetical protein